MFSSMVDVTDIYEKMGSHSYMFYFVQLIYFISRELYVINDYVNMGLYMSHE